MSFYASEMLVGVQSFRVCCDICQTGFQPPLGEINELMIRRSTQPRHNSFGAESFDSVPVITREMITAEMIASGWKVETFHGKEYIVCKECASK